MIEAITGHLRAAVGRCRHDYRPKMVGSYVEAIDGQVSRFAFECRYCNDELIIADRQCE